MTDQQRTNPLGAARTATPDGDRECYQFDFDLQGLTAMRREHPTVESHRGEPPARVGGMPPMPVFVAEPDLD